MPCTTSVIRKVCACLPGSELRAVSPRRFVRFVRFIRRRVPIRRSFFGKQLIQPPSTSLHKSFFLPQKRNLRSSKNVFIEESWGATSSQSRPEAASSIASSIADCQFNCHLPIASSVANCQLPVARPIANCQFSCQLPVASCQASCQLPVQLPVASSIGNCQLPVKFRPFFRPSHTPPYEVHFKLPRASARASKVLISGRRPIQNRNSCSDRRTPPHTKFVSNFHGRALAPRKF